MSINRRIAFGAAASWFSRGVTIVLGLVLMPVLFRHLPKEELGVWLLLGQSWVALGVFEYGIQMVFTRYFAFAAGKAGASVETNHASVVEIGDLTTVTLRVYRWLSVIIFIITWLSGYFYLRHVNAPAMGFGPMILAWTVLCLGNAINVWSNPWSCLLAGVGYVGWDSVVGSLVQVLTILAQIVAVLCGGGVVTLALVACIGGLIQRFLVRGLIRRKRPELFRIRGQWNPSLFRQICGPAIRATLTSLAGALLTNTDQLFIGYARDISELPAFRAGFLLAVNLNMLANTFGGISVVFISQLWQAWKIEAVHHLLIRNLRLGLIIFGCGAACLLVAGNEIVTLWLGPNNFVGYPILGVFLLSQALESNIYIISSASRATNDEAFVWSTAASGLLKLGLAFVLIRTNGLIGLALSTLIAQLVTNHWFVTLRGLTRLELPMGTYLKNVLLPVAIGFSLLYLGLTCLRGIMSGMAGWKMIVAVAGSSGLICVLAIAFFAVTREERQRIKSMVFRTQPA